MLRVRGLSRPGLAGIDLDLPGGTATALMGPSGAGKTLLLRAIADLDPNDGELSLDGVAREAMPAPAWRRRVTYLAAEPGWWAELAGDHFPQPTAATSLLDSLGLAAALLGQPVRQLSTGERHRLALARVLVQEPPVLLLDEPTASLDAASAARVEAVLRARLAAGTAVLFSTHDAELARRIAGRVLHIGHGRLAEPAS